MFVRNPKQATPEEIIAHNRLVRAHKNLLYEEYAKKLNELPKTIVPCKTCNYDGLYRCEACEDNDYEGYNIRDYPN